jgi:hypothetical protein
MTYSKIHQAFSERLKNPDVLTNPGKYLGPNWKDVLNFWIYFEGLSDEEKYEMDDRYWDLDGSVRDYSIVAACDAAKEVVGREFRDAAWNAAWGVTGWMYVFCDASYELIGHHKLLEQNKPLTFLPFCIRP